MPGIVLTVGISPNTGVTSKYHKRRFNALFAEVMRQSLGVQGLRLSDGEQDLSRQNSIFNTIT